MTKLNDANEPNLNHEWTTDPLAMRILKLDQHDIYTNQEKTQLSISTMIRCEDVWRCVEYPERFWIQSHDESRKMWGIKNVGYQDLIMIHVGVQLWRWQHLQ